jgi:hypothetical protein
MQLIRKSKSEPDFAVATTFGFNAESNDAKSEKRAFRNKANGSLPLRERRPSVV